MSVFLFSSDVQLSALIETQIRTSGMDAATFHNPTDVANAVRSGLPGALIVDLGGRPRDAVRIIEDTHRAFPAAQVPIVALHDGRTVSERLAVALQVDRNHLPTDLGRRVRTVIAVHQNPDIHGQAHPYALELLARVWRQALSGHAVIEGTSVTIAFCDGGIINPDDIPALEHALTQRGLSFNPDNTFGLGDWYTVGQTLYNAARTRTGEGFFTRNRKLVLKARPHADRAEQLPLREATLSLLGDRRTLAMPLARRLASLQIPPAHVEQDLEVLWLLGLHRFQAPIKRPARARKALQHLPQPSTRHSNASTRSVSSDEPRHRGRISPEMKAQLELKRLRREVKSLADVDDWTVLSLQPTHDLSAVEAASARMQSRYLKVSAGTDNPETRRLAQQLVTRIEEATASLKALVAVYSAYGPPDAPDSREEIAFREGFSALQRRDIPRAHRLFAAAYDEHMQSPRNLVYMAWTTHLAKGPSRLDEVLEYLQLADSLTPNVPQTQFFLATIESERGDLERAEQRLARLIKTGNASQEAHSLFRRVRQQRAQRR